MADAYYAFTDPASGGTVAVTFDANSNAVQLFTLASSGAAFYTDVVSVAGGVALRVLQTGSLNVGQFGTWSAQATQAGSWTVSIGGTPTFVGSAAATQAGSWTVSAQSATGTVGIIGDVGVTQTTSPWIMRAGSTGDPQGTFVGSAAATQAGSWTVSAQSATGAFGIIGNVSVTQADSPWATTGGGDGKILDRNDSAIGATVESNAAGGNVYVIVTSTRGGGTTITGSVDATQSGSWVVSIGNQPTVTATIPNVVAMVGSGAATQAGSWIVTANQGGSWSFQATSTGEPQGTVVASIPNVVTVIGSQAVSFADSVSVRMFAESGTTTGYLTVTSDNAGPLLRVHAVGSNATDPPTSVLAIQQGSWGVDAAQSGSWTFTGSVGATQLGAPWTTVASVIGQPTVTASVTGQVTVTASVAGMPAVIGSVEATQAGAWTFTGSVGATQLGAPWTSVASVIGQPTVTASIAGTVAVVGSVQTTQAYATARMVKIAWEVTSALPFPFDGVTPLVRQATAAASTGLSLATDVLSADLTGLLVTFPSSGTARNVWRRIGGWLNQDSLDIFVTSAWESGQVPASGATYRLLIDTGNSAQLRLRSEVASTGTGLWFSAGRWDVPQVGSSTQTAPHMERLQLIDPVPSSYDVLTSGYYQAEGKTVDVAGFIGAKIYVTSVSNGAFSLWADAV